VSSNIASVPDRTIASLAIIKVNFDRRQSYIENFAPFLRHCLAKAESDVVSAPDLQTSVVQEFGLELPQAILTTLLRREERDGRVVREHGVYRKKPGMFEDADLETERAEASRRQTALIIALATYAKHKFGREWNEDQARTVLMAYLEDYSTAVLAATVVGRSLSAGERTLTGDHYIVHSFALHASGADPPSFEFLTAVVKGQMLADSVYLGEREFENHAPLTSLELYFDGPILLYLLGYGGPELAAPHTEPLALLKQQKAVLRCFEDGIAEAQHILDAAASKVRRAKHTAAFTAML
jgi:hypothetical protein